MIKQISGRSSNAAPVVRLWGLLGIATGFLSACQIVEPSLPNPSQQKVLVLIAREDPAGSFDGLENTLSHNFNRLPGVEPTFRRVDGVSEFREAILSSGRLEGDRLDGLVLAFHGKPNRLHLSATETLNQRNVRDHCEDLHLALRPKAPVILYSCLTGEGEDNLAADLAKHLRRPVVAPSYYWLMQTPVPLEERISELKLDPQGRLTIDRSQFALYYKKRHSTYRDRYLIAPMAMHALCLGDGFVQRPSRFRGLFQRFNP